MSKKVLFGIIAFLAIGGIVTVAFMGAVANEITKDNCEITYSTTVVESYKGYGGLVNYPDAGNEIMHVTGTLKNTAYSGTLSNNPIYFKLVCDNVEYLYKYRGYDSASAQEGGSVSFDIYYEIPLNAKEISLIYTDFGANPVYSKI